MYARMSANDKRAIVLAVKSRTEKFGFGANGATEAAPMPIDELVDAYGAPPELMPADGGGGEYITLPLEAPP